MYKKIINIVSNFVKIIIPIEKLNYMQNILLQIDVYIKVEELISFLMIITSFLFIIFLFLGYVFDFSIYITIFISIIPVILLVNLVLYKYEHKQDIIEEDLPDFLRQVASLLRVGLGLESALTELSKSSDRPLNNEIKRALLEIRFGKSFNDSLLDITNRNDSDNLKHIFQIIIYSKESGGNLANILDTIAVDLSDIIMLRKERKASVMMSVMFLLISSIIATPFALGMIRLYSEFIEQIGKYNPLITVIPLVSVGYMIIHSILVSILLGIVMYSDIKKGIKYIFIIMPVSLLIYYISQLIFKGILGIGGIL